MRTRYWSSILITYISFLGLAFGEAFFGPTTETNRLMINADEAVFIRGFSVDPNTTFYSDLVVSNKIFQLSMGMSTMAISAPAVYALSGPAELVVPRPCAICFDRLRNVKVGMVVLEKHPYILELPRGKRIQFLTNRGWGSPEAIVTAAGRTFKTDIHPNHVFEGPLTLVFDPSSGSNRADTFLTSYIFVESTFVNPAVLPIGPQIWAEKSTDMTNWVPVATFPAGLDSNGFYRLRILE